MGNGPNERFIPADFMDAKPLVSAQNQMHKIYMIKKKIVYMIEFMYSIASHQNKILEHDLGLRIIIDLWPYLL